MGLWPMNLGHDTLISEVVRGYILSSRVPNISVLSWIVLQIKAMKTKLNDFNCALCPYIK
jgi:hypothetical protein